MDIPATMTPRLLRGKESVNVGEAKVVDEEKSPKKTTSTSSALQSFPAPLPFL
jgi:hypothetical protein